ncbi:MAG TPA: alpha/beta hydrolase, partial [Verrucomicrobiota bacterium]|nr:alpha/beta hydrolase [Verrucomicrobiota bacterium]
MKKILRWTTLLIALIGINVSAQEEVIRLWEKDAPYAQGKEDKDIPTLTVYLPAEGKANGSAVVVCPGGGYWGLSDYEYEGAGYARFLTSHGVSVFVLRYRLASNGYHYPVMLMDGARAIRVVRSQAQKWGIDVDRVGVMGSSAGGHLAALLMTHYEKANPALLDPIDSLSSRPDLAILCYPVITAGDFAHSGSIQNLLGPNFTAGLAEYVSIEKQVDKNTPPCFIWHTFEDEVVPTENALLLATALRKAGVPFDLHIYEKRIHGLALAGKRWTTTQGMDEKD